MTMTPTELAALPATEGHIERAREAVRSLPSKQAYLDALLASNPTRGQMVEFMESLRSEVEAAQVEQRINQICKAAGIDMPTSTDRLMAMQIGLLQEQNTILQNGMTRALNQMKADAQKDESSGLFTAFLGGTLIAATLSR